jgi:hypothetical protein
MTSKEQREKIKLFVSNVNVVTLLLQTIGIDITKDGFIRVRPEDRTPSCKINKDGSFYDFGSSEYYSDIVALLYDGYAAFDSLTDTMQWVCQQVNIPWEVNDGQS